MSDEKYLDIKTGGSEIPNTDDSHKSINIQLSGPWTGILVAFCGYARLQELERRRNVHGILGYQPLPPLEQLEYEELRHWWNRLGPNKQDNIAAFVRSTSKHAAALQGNLSATGLPR